MPKKPHTELDVSSTDGPWIIMRDGDDSLMLNWRELVRDLMPAQASAQRRRIMARWLKARDAEGTTVTAAVPDVPIGVKLGPRLKARQRP